LTKLRDLCDLKACPLLRIGCSCGEKLINEKVRDGENTIAQLFVSGRDPLNDHCHSQAAGRVPKFAADTAAR